MSSFQDELKKLAPGISDGCAAALEKEYGNCTGFHTGLDVMAKILNSGQISKVNPAFGEPWQSLYQETVSIAQMKGCQLLSAFSEALQNGGFPTLPLYDAVNFRIAAIAQQAANGNDKTLSDFISGLSMLGFNIRRNLAGKKLEVDNEPISDGVASVIRMKMRDSGFKNRQDIMDAVNVAGENNKYHPVRDYLSSLKWDGVERIRDLAKYFEAVYEPIWPIVLRKWLIGSIDRVMTAAQNPMLVLDGPQGCGKSFFARWLCPLPRHFREGPIDPTNRDDKIAAAENWIWEVSELGSTTRKADREALKSFLTTQTFTARASYGHNNEQYDMMASFLGTINDEAGFLDDPTGNRRFWVVKLDGINPVYSKKFNVEQIWAEAYAAWKSGESHDLLPDEYETMQHIAEEYRVISATEEAIKKCFQIDPDDPKLAQNFVPFTEIRAALADPLRGNLSGQDLSDRKISAALRSLGLKDTRRYIALKPGISSKKQVRGYTGLEIL